MENTIDDIVNRLKDGSHHYIYKKFDGLSILLSESDLRYLLEETYKDGVKFQEEQEPVETEDNDDDELEIERLEGKVERLEKKNKELKEQIHELKGDKE